MAERLCSSTAVLSSPDFDDPIPVKEFQKNLTRLIKRASRDEVYWSNLLNPRFELYNHLIRDLHSIDLAGV